MVGLIPLFAVETIEPEMLRKLPAFARRMQWFIDNRPEFAEHVEMVEAPGRDAAPAVDRDARAASPRAPVHARRAGVPVRPRGPLVSRVHRARPYVLDGTACRAA
jgi:hypothetical protein